MIGFSYSLASFQAHLSEPRILDCLQVALQIDGL